MSFLDKIKGKILPTDPGEHDMTNDRLMKKIVDHYKDTIILESMEGCLLFHTGFTIYMNSDDFASREPALPFVVRAAVNKMHADIRERSKAYTGYRPHAQSWQFHFLPFNDGSLVEVKGSKFSTIPSGEILIVSTLAPANENTSDAQPKTRVVATVSGKKTMFVNASDLNLRALNGLDIRGKNLFRVKFDGFNDLQEDPISDYNRKNAPQPTKALARLQVTASQFLTDGVSTNICEMTSEILQVMGRNGSASSSRRQVARLDSVDVMNPHLEIRYTTAGFTITAYGDVVLNEVPLPQDPSLATPLPPNSSILINGSIQIYFKKP